MFAVRNILKAMSSSKTGLFFFSHISHLQFWKINEPLTAIYFQTSCHLEYIGSLKVSLMPARICVWIAESVTPAQVRL